MRDFTVPGFGVRPPFDGHPWHPRALFAGGAAGALYLPGPTTCFQDAAGTTPAGDGDPVGYLADLSGNGNHATQATSAARPTLAQVGGLWRLEFDGVDDVLGIPASAMVYGTAARSILAGWMPTQEESTVLDYGDLANGRRFYLPVRSNHPTIVTYSYTLTPTATVPYGDTVVQTVVVPDAAAVMGDMQMWVDGAARTLTGDTASTFNTVSSGAATLGSAQNGYYQSRVSGFIALDRAMTATERARAERYLANISGVTL